MALPRTSTLDTFLSVAELTHMIRGLLEDAFPHVRVRGEISTLRKPSSGHLYFTLGDGEAQIRAVVWRTGAARLPAPPRDGDAVLVTGRLAVYPPRGEYQLIVEGLESAGSGDERERLLQLHARLAREGLFEESRKRSLPLLPGVVGVVTSPGGAVIHDIIQVLERRFPGFHLLLAPARVQGEEAPAEIVRALAALNADGRAEVIICGRGGGSAEDLAAFNTEIVVRAIAGSRAPVISAVGHEVDITLADLAADLRCPTPSVAAERVLPERAVLLERIAALDRRLVRAMAGLLERQRQRLRLARARIIDPRRRLEAARQRTDELGERLLRALQVRIQSRHVRLDGLTDRLTVWPTGAWLPLRRQRLAISTRGLQRAMQSQLAGRRQRLSAAQARLRSLDPGSILARGYAIVRDGQGRILRSPATLAPRDPLHITLADGAVTARVEQAPDRDWGPESRE